MAVAMAEETFADRLRSLRQAAGLTQQQLAEAAGVTLSNVTQLEQGVIRNPRMSTLVALSKALGATLDALVGGD